MASEAEMASLELAQEKEKQHQSSNNKAHQALPCPRCHSWDTKFCYFNNYNLAQPRHHCRSCRRYWTHGGALRDVPVGGASRKTHLSSSSSASNKRRRATASPEANPQRGNDPPQMEIVTSAADVTSTSSGFFMGLGLGPFGFEILPEFDALQGFGLGHHACDADTRAFWTRTEAASNSAVTTTAATASYTVTGGGEGLASTVDSPGVDRWRLEDAILQGDTDEEFNFNLSMSVPTKGLN